MVPVIAARGASFKGAFAYYFHDKKAWTSDRVAWTETINLLSNCVEKAWRFMAYTAAHQEKLKRASNEHMSGAKLRKPVFSYSLSWHPEEKPSKKKMMSAVTESLELLGLAEHQAIVAAHADEPHPHVHVIASVVHPRTGLVARLKNTKRVLSAFALRFEQRNGKIYCRRRQEASRRRSAKAGGIDPVFGEAWRRTVTGQEFADFLRARGYRLTEGTKRIVAVNPQGEIVYPVRHLPGVSATAFRSRFAGLSLIFHESNETPSRCVERVAEDKSANFPAIDCSEDAAVDRVVPPVAHGNGRGVANNGTEYAKSFSLGRVFAGAATGCRCLKKVLSNTFRWMASRYSGALLQKKAAREPGCFEHSR
jgi:hypothetical protein